MSHATLSLHGHCRLNVARSVSVLEMRFNHPDQFNRSNNLVFVYSCPSNSPIKHRMLYSSGSTTTYNAAKSILASLSPPASIVSRKVETSEPKELDEAYLMTELGFQDQPQPPTGAPKPFAKPKGPPRRR